MLAFNYNVEKVCFFFFPLRAQDLDFFLLTDHVASDDGPRRTGLVCTLAERSFDV